jgi:membrane associated rhomboid family serine protease
VPFSGEQVSEGAPGTIDRTAGETVTCYRHPDRQTGIRCQRCERPICTSCMVPAPVGFQCVDCVRAARSRAIPARALLARGRPYLTYALVGVNLAVWLAGLVLGGSAALRGVSGLAAMAGLAAQPVAAGEWWRLFTAGFLHSGLLHLAFNMAALIVLGPLVERALGRAGFLAVYVMALVASSLGALLVTPGAFTVGASGAIFGLMGAAIVGQRTGRVDSRVGSLLPWLVINLVFTVAVPGISIGGHLGGLAAGVAAGLIFGRRRSGAAPIAACLALAAACVWAALRVAGSGL